MERLKKENQPTMNENLTDMLKNTPPEEGTMLFSEKDLDIPTVDTSASEDAQPEVIEETTPEQNVVTVTSLATWFDAFSDGLDNINQVKVSIRGIDPVKTLIIAVKDGSNEVDEQGNDKRNLRVFENADTTPILNLSPLAMNIYNNGFRTIYQYNDNVFIKAYGIRTGLICALCTNVNGKLIPYAIHKVKKKDENFEFPLEYPTITDEVLSANTDLENLQILYKQSSKVVETLSTNQSVIDWLTERQELVTDINHHLQIDNVMISIMS